jgi:hypothetical protein
MTEIKRTVDGVEHVFRCSLVRRSDDWAALRYVSEAAHVVGSLQLPPGTETMAHYWTGRPYTAYHWLDPEGRTLGVYLNAASGVEITRDAVRWQDLALDVLVTAQGGVEVLDEDQARDAPAWAQPAIAHARELLLRQGPAIASEVAELTQRIRAPQPRVRRKPG